MQQFFVLLALSTLCVSAFPQEDQVISVRAPDGACIWKKIKEVGTGLSDAAKAISECTKDARDAGQNIFEAAQSIEKEAQQLQKLGGDWQNASFVARIRIFAEMMQSVAKIGKDVSVIAENIEAIENTDIQDCVRPKLESLQNSLGKFRECL